MDHAAAQILLLQARLLLLQAHLQFLQAHLQFLQAQALALLWHLPALPRQAAAHSHQMLAQAYLLDLWLLGITR
jgi:hypothetical protein